MYLHCDHKYLSDKGLPSFVLKPSEETQVKAKFGLIDNLLASDLAGGEVNAEVELMFAVVFKLPFGVEAIYLGRFVCSDLKFANSSSKVGQKWTMLVVPRIVRMCQSKLLNKQKITKVVSSCYGLQASISIKLVLPLNLSLCFRLLIRNVIMN